MGMKTQILHRSAFVPKPVEEVFPFFAKAANLTKITPSWLDFEILTPEPIEMREGLVIDYRIRLRGIPMRWRSEISVWNPPHSFVDEQLKGPYRLWVHEHKFEPMDGGTKITDHIRYAVWGGALIERIFVRPDLKRIFDGRQQRMAELFDARPLPTTEFA